MILQRDIHIIWPHPVPSGQVFIAGDWNIPGYNQWEKLPMLRIPGMDSYEINLTVQEAEDMPASAPISDVFSTKSHSTHQQLDSPYHHQNKDEITLPLTREYRYQFKFVIDDEWTCDATRFQVQDTSGLWNHELAVDLVETVGLDIGKSNNKSRSSSLSGPAHVDLGVKEDDATNDPFVLEKGRSLAEGKKGGSAGLSTISIAALTNASLM